jgi:hypothetical protein
MPGLLIEMVLNSISRWLAYNHNPPDLCLLSGWNYKCKPSSLREIPFLNDLNMVAKVTYVDQFFISNEKLA